MPEIDTAAILDAVDREALAGLAIDLTAIPSLPGDEATVGRFLEGYLRERGFETELQEVEPGRFNVIGRLRGSGGGRSLMFNGHLDIDPIARNWKRDPFTPSREGDRIYGAGVSNMKAGIASMVTAVDAIRRSGQRLRGDVVIAGVVGETQGGVGSGYLETHGPLTDAAIVPEPFGTDSILTVHTGWGQAAVHLLGRSAHISDMESGVDALQFAAKAAEALRSMRFTCTPRPDLPALPRLLVGAMVGGQGRDYYLRGANWVCDFASLFIDLRWNHSQDEASVRADLRRTLDEVKAATPGFEYELELPAPKHFGGIYEIEPAYELPRAGRYVLDAVTNAYQRVTGRAPAVRGGAKLPDSYAVGDTGHLQRAGVMSVLYGPGSYRWTDDPYSDTYSTVTDMEIAAKVMALAAVEICSQSKAQG